MTTFTTGTRITANWLNSVATKDQANTFTRACAISSIVLTDSASILTDASLSNTFTVTLGANRTLANPTNLVEGGIYTWHFNTGAGPYGITSWGTVFDFGTSGSPTFTATINKIDMISGQYIGGKLRMGTLLKGYS